MKHKFQPGDLIRSTSGYVHLIWAVCDDHYYYEIYENGKRKHYYSFHIEDYENYALEKLSKLELALL